MRNAVAKRIRGRFFILGRQCDLSGEGGRGYPSHLGKNGVNRGSHGRIVCQIEWEGARISRGQQRQPVHAPGDREHRAACKEQSLNRRPADAVGDPRDQRNFGFHVFVVGVASCGPRRVGEQHVGKRPLDFASESANIPLKSTFLATVEGHVFN